MKVIFNKERQCNPDPRQGKVYIMTRSDLPQILREILGLTLTLAGLTVATVALFSL